VWSPSAGILAFAKCRNEILRLPAFLRHYRALGVERFFIVDNDSHDGSVEYLAAQPDVQVTRTTARFGDSCGGADWLNPLLTEFGSGAWCVTVDVDELLVYPGSEHATLPAFTRYLDECGHDAVACLLLDLYPSGPLDESRYEAGGDLLDAAPYFDAGPYSRRPVAHCPGVLIRGGMRERVFYPERRGVRGLLARVTRRSTPPCLTKIPLVRWTPGTRYLHANHWITERRVAPETGVLLHFKFLDDFHDRAIAEAERGEYYNRASEYVRYAERLRREATLTLRDAASLRYEGTGQLVALGLMQDGAAWARQRVIGTT
jgi:hypothetical protein